MTRKLVLAVAACAMLLAAVPGVRAWPCPEGQAYDEGKGKCVGCVVDNCADTAQQLCPGNGDKPAPK